MDTIIRSTSQAITSAVTSSMGHAPDNYDAYANARSLRASYLEAFEQPNTKEILIKVGQAVVENLKTMDGVPYTGDTATVAHDGKIFQLEGMLLAGREHSDIRLPSRMSSRIHAIIFPLRHLGKIAVIDVGSAFGISTCTRSSDRKLEHSLPHDRRALLFDYDEVVLLNMGDQKVMLNARICLVCMERLRTVRYGCGHQAVCTICDSRLSNCPICRAPTALRACIIMASTTNAI